MQTITITVEAFKEKFQIPIADIDKVVRSYTGKAILYVNGLPGQIEVMETYDEIVKAIKG